MIMREIREGLAVMSLQTGNFHGLTERVRITGNYVPQPEKISMIC